MNHRSLTAPNVILTRVSCSVVIDLPSMGRMVRSRPWAGHCGTCGLPCTITDPDLRPCNLIHLMKSNPTPVI